MPLDKLRDLAVDVEFLVGTRRSAKAIRSMFIAGLQAGELAGPLVGLELQGLANHAASSEDLLLTVDELAVKYESTMYVDPVARLGLAVLQLALAVDGHNRRQKTTVGTEHAQQHAPQHAPQQREAICPDNIAISAEYSDL
jgi:hypothetical protein